MKACCLIRAQPHYRADAFRRGLAAIGAVDASDKDCDLLVIWNRYGEFGSKADAVERRGGTVLVVENGYLGNEFAGARWYAMARTGHNGAGAWEAAGPERWDGLGIELAPFHCDGQSIVLLPQRGIGPLGVAMPAQWSRDAVARLAKLTRREVRVRNHPGVRTDGPTLEQDLADAWAVVTWGSGAAIKALTLGIPVFHDFTQWIGAGAGLPLGAPIEQPNRSAAARLAMFRRLIWAQWRLEEIESGEAFDRLLCARC